MDEPVCVSVVATDPVLEVGATSALRGCSDVVVVSGDDDVAAVVVVIVDGVGEEMFALVRAIRSSVHRPAVVLVAPDLTPSEALRALAIGACALLRRREATVDRMIRTVLAASAGDCTVPPDMLDRLLEQTAADGRTRAIPIQWNVSGISERERAVLRMVAEGRETSEIAKELCYSARTVTSVVHDITQRFRLRNRAHAVAYALRAGML